MKLSVIGLGKLGAPMAASFAERGFEVVGADFNQALVDHLKGGLFSFSEPLLNQRLSDNASRLRWTCDIAEAVQDSQASFIVVPTPSQDNGDFSCDFVVAAAEGIGRALAAKGPGHLVVLTSTVMPLHCQTLVIPALERTSGLLCGEGFHFCYSPEFIALGSVIRDLENPDLVLIGEQHPQGGERLAQIYQQACCNQPQFIRTNLVNAEIAKISLNAYITMKISFANTLARLCERVPQADSREVSRALGADTRIGPKYLRGALAYAGPCFPRDNLAFSNFAQQQGVEARLAAATVRVNQEQLEFLVQLTRSLLGDRRRLGVLGLAYKPGTAVVEQSPGLALLESLRDSNLDLKAYDPVAQPLVAGVQLCLSAEDCIRHSDVLIVATPWAEFRQLPAALFESKTVLDCWDCLEQAAQARDCDYRKLGEPSCLAPRVETASSHTRIA